MSLMAVRTTSARGHCIWEGTDRGEVTPRRWLDQARAFA